MGVQGKKPDVKAFIVLLNVLAKILYFLRRKISENL